MPISLKNFFKKVFFFGLAFGLFLLFSIIILEIARRVTGDHAVVNPLFNVTQQGEQYLFKPNSTSLHTSPDTGEKYDVHYNRFGYRGPDFKMPKPKGTMRVFVIGDSFTHGIGMSDRDTIPRLIEANLQKRYKNIEVVNAGIGHTSPITHYINLKKIHLQYDPDLVILLLDMTDLWDDWHSERSAIFDKSGEIKNFNLNYINGRRSIWRTLVSHSRACQFINNKIVRTFKKIRLLGLKGYIRVCLEKKRAKAAIILSDNIKDKDILTEYDGLLFMRGTKRKELIDHHFIRTAKYLNKIKDLLDKEGIPFILASYPHGIYVGKDEWSEGRKTWGFESGKIYTDYYPFDLLKEYAKKNNVTYIDTLNDFLAAKKANPQKLFFYRWDGHLNPSGNQILSQSLLQNPKFQEIFAQLIAK